MSKNDFRPETYKDTKKAVTNFADLCKSCGLCIEKCPKDCLAFDEERNGHFGTPAVKCDIDQCIACGICELHCPDEAMKVDKLN